MQTVEIEVKGARTHNLQNISLKIPLGKWTTITGVSGSGKSSLVFDTIYAESQRRFLETIGTYERQFLQGLPEPDCDSISNIPASVALKQNNKSGDPRSVIGTSADILEPLRILFSTLMDVSCSKCGASVEISTATQLIDFLQTPTSKKESLSTNSFALLAPISELPTNIYKFLSAALAEGYTRFTLLQGNTTRKIHYIEDFLSQKENFENLKTGTLKTKVLELELLLDIIFAESENAEIQNKVETLWSQIRYAPNFNSLIVRKLSKSSTSEKIIFEKTETLFHIQPFCKVCASSTTTIQNRDLDWQSALGACQKCSGIGNVPVLDESKIIPNPNKPLVDGGIKPWSTDTYKNLAEHLEKNMKLVGIKTQSSWSQLDTESKRWIWQGYNETEKKNSLLKAKKHISIQDFFSSLETERYKQTSRILLAKYRKYVTCQTCEGTRLSQVGRNASCDNVKFETLVHQPIENTLAWIESLEKSKKFQAKLLAVREIFSEVTRKLKLLCELGLGSQPLTRRCKSLSGGEYQRVLLTRVVGNGLSDAIYVLDEPSVGLGKAEIPNLIQIVKKLRDLGNTILMVEHDPMLIKASDDVVELGPSGGENGGKIVSQSVAPISAIFNSTLIAPKRTSIASLPQKVSKISLEDFSFLHCKNINVEFPLASLSVISGPSGSGKSTLLMCGLGAALEAFEDFERTNNTEQNIDNKVGSWKKLSLPTSFFENFQTVIVDQKPLHRSVASVPATLLGLMDVLRKKFAELPDSQKKRLTPADFGFNGAGGCTTCSGKGTVEDDLFFLGAVEKICPDCNGTRYKPKVQGVLWMGKNISEWMNTSLAEAFKLVGSVQSFRKPLSLAMKLGIGHLSLGDSTSNLSGGEAQRLKICASLCKSQKSIVCLLDEPTRGLSEKDVSDLLSTLRELCELGHTFICVEHHEKFIEYADYLIEVGPGAGALGGKITSLESRKF